MLVGVFCTDERHFVVDQSFDRPQFSTFFGAAERQGHSFCAGAAGPPDAVHVGFRFDRDVEVDHVCDAFDIDATCGNIGCHQHTGPPVAEVFECSLAGTLRLVAVDHRSADAGAD